MKKPKLIMTFTVGFALVAVTTIGCGPSRHEVSLREHIANNLSPSYQVLALEMLMSPDQCTGYESRRFVSSAIENDITVFRVELLDTSQFSTGEPETYLFVNDGKGWQHFMEPSY